jgi:redox-sensitive bicupin YhaK (pirin superfamily)
MHDPEIRRAAERGRMTTDWLDAQFSFAFADHDPPGRRRFSVLRVLNEDRIQPATGFGMHPHRDMEILLMPLEGAVAHADSLGHRAVLHPDEVLRMSAGAGLTHSQMNASDRVLDHHLQLWLLPRQRGTAPRVDWRRFDGGGREGRWQAIASGDGRDGSLVIDQDATVWRARLRAGATLAYAPPPERSLYLHVARGSVDLDGPCGGVLAAGDAAAWTQGPAFTLGGRDDAELVLFDLPPHHP